MSRNLVTSITAEFAGRLFHAAVAGALLIFLTRILGPESYGVFALAVSIFAFSRLFSELGIARSAARYVAEYKDDRPGTATVVVAESRIFAVVAAVAVAFALAVAADRIAGFLDEPALAPVLVVGSGFVLFYSLHQYNRILLQGYENVTASASLHALEAAFTGVFVVVFVLYEPAATTAVIGYASGYGAVTVAGYVVVNRVSAPAGRRSPRRSETDDNPTSRTELRLRILKYNVPLTVTRLSSVVDRQVDVLLVGYFLNPLAVAFYTIGKELSRLVNVPAASLGFALSPSYGADKAAGRLENAASIYGESLEKVLVLYVPACTGIVLVADVAIPTVFGDEYAGAIVVVQILALFIFFEGLAYISSHSLDYLGRARSRAVVKSITSAGNFGLNLLLIPTVGVVGAAVATVITHGVYSLATVYFVYTELAFDLRSVGRHLVRVSAITLLMALVVYAIVQALSGFAALFFAIGSGIGIWLVGCHVFDLLDYRRVVAKVRGRASD